MMRYVINFVRDFIRTIELSSVHGFFETLRIFIVIRKVRRHTKVRIPRLKTLYSLTKKLDKLSMKGDIVEFGVWRGGSGAVLAHAAKKSPFHRTIWLFDSFKGYPAPSQKDFGTKLNTSTLKGRSKVNENKVHELFKKMKIPKESYKIIKGFYEDTLPRFRSPSISLIHFDAVLYNATIISLRHLYDKVQPGGFLVFNTWEYEGTRNAVNDFFQERNVTLQSYDVDGVGRYFKKPLA